MIGDWLRGGRGDRRGCSVRDKGELRGGSCWIFELLFPASCMLSCIMHFSCEQLVLDRHCLQLGVHTQQQQHMSLHIHDRMAFIHCIRRAFLHCIVTLINQTPEVIPPTQETQGP